MIKSLKSIFFGALPQSSAHSIFNGFALPYDVTIPLISQPSVDCLLYRAYFFSIALDDTPADLVKPGDMKVNIGYMQDVYFRFHKTCGKAVSRAAVVRRILLVRGSKRKDQRERTEDVPLR